MPSQMCCMVTNVTVRTWRQKNHVVVKCERTLPALCPKRNSSSDHHLRWSNKCLGASDKWPRPCCSIWVMSLSLNAALTNGQSRLHIKLRTVNSHNYVHETFVIFKTIVCIWPIQRILYPDFLNISLLFGFLCKQGTHFWPCTFLHFVSTFFCLYCNIDFLHVIGFDTEFYSDLNRKLLLYSTWTFY